MNLVDFRRGRPTEAVYIGRAMRGLDCSPLRNPFRSGQDKDKAAISVSGHRTRVIERYRRHLVWSLAHGYPDPANALRSLRRDSVLGCWCATRPARILHGPLAQLDDLCHGDVVFTAWLGLDALGWKWRTGSRGPDPKDFEAFPAIQAELYEAIFHQPLTWGNERP